MDKTVVKFAKPEKAAGTENKVRWLRVEAAKQYYHICRNTLDKIALECDAKKKISGVCLYDANKIDKYIETM